MVAPRAGSRVAGGAAAGGAEVTGAEIGGEQTRGGGTPQRRRHERSGLDGGGNGRRGLWMRRGDASNGSGRVGSWARARATISWISSFVLPQAEPSTSAWLSDGQVRREESHRRQVQSPVRQHSSTTETVAPRGHFDAVIGFALGHAQRIPAVGEERSVPLAQANVARVQLREVGHDGAVSVRSRASEFFSPATSAASRKEPERSEDVVLHAGVVAPALDTLSRSL